MNVIKAVEFMKIFDEFADTNGKTKMLHVAVYIVSRFIAELGNLWPWSTAKLEARGARCKRIVRRQTSGRGRSVAKVDVTIKKKGTAVQRRKGEAPSDQVKVLKRAYDSSRCSQLLGMIGLREGMALSGKSRRATQLAECGKLKVERKLRSRVLRECRTPSAGSCPIRIPFRALPCLNRSCAASSSRCTQRRASCAPLPRWPKVGPDGPNWPVTLPSQPL